MTVVLSSWLEKIEKCKSNIRCAIDNGILLLSGSRERQKGKWKEVDILCWADNSKYTYSRIGSARRPGN